MKLVWSRRFVRAVKKMTRRDPNLLEDLHHALQLLESNPHDPKLRTHRLSGDLAGCWACSAGYDLRIIFEFSRPRPSAVMEIHLLTVGTHDEVY